MNNTFIFKIIACSLTAFPLFASESKFGSQMTADDAIDAYIRQIDSGQDAAYTPAELALYRNMMEAASIVRKILNKHYGDHPLIDQDSANTEVLFESGGERVHYTAQTKSEPIAILANIPSGSPSVSINSKSMPALSFVPNSKQLVASRSHSGASSPTMTRSSNSPRSLSGRQTLSSYERIQSTNLSAAGLFLHCKDGHPCALVNPWSCYAFWSATDCESDRSLKEKIMREVKKKLTLGEQLIGEETYPILKIGTTTLPSPKAARASAMQTNKLKARLQAMQEFVATYKEPSLLTRLCCCKCAKNKD